MPEKNTLRQREYKERMYAAGYKQKMIWLPRETGEKISRSKFMKRFEELTNGWSSDRLSVLFAVILAIVERKGVRRKNSQ
jgi:hypothetical protein